MNVPVAEMNRHQMSVQLSLRIVLHGQASMTVMTRAGDQIPGSH
jgi:hypothetical protein